MMRSLGVGSRMVHVDRNELIGKLKANRETHQKDYKEALIGYQAMAISNLTGHIEKLRTNPTTPLYFDLPVPTDYSKAYDVAIQMMEMEKRPIVELSSTEFSCFVMDDWEWKDNFNEAKMNYTSTRR